MSRTHITPPACSRRPPCVTCSVQRTCRRFYPRETPYPAQCRQVWQPLIGGARGYRSRDLPPPHFKLGFPFVPSVSVSETVIATHEKLPLTNVLTIALLLHSQNNCRCCWDIRSYFSLVETSLLYDERCICRPLLNKFGIFWVEEAWGLRVGVGVESCKIMFLGEHFLSTGTATFAVWCIVYPQCTASQTDGRTDRQTYWLTTLSCQ